MGYWPWQFRFSILGLLSFVLVVSIPLATLRYLPRFHAYSLKSRFIDRRVDNAIFANVTELEIHNGGRVYATIGNSRYLLGMVDSLRSAKVIFEPQTLREFMQRSIRFRFDPEDQTSNWRFFRFELRQGRFCIAPLTGNEILVELGQG